MSTNRNDEPERIDYHPPATWSSDYQVLKSMIFANVQGSTQQERLESFYVSQADLYDSYRHRMLYGRFPMISKMPAPKGGVWCDIGDNIILATQNIIQSNNGQYNALQEVELDQILNFLVIT